MPVKTGRASSSAGVPGCPSARRQLSSDDTEALCPEGSIVTGGLQAMAECGHKSGTTRQDRPADDPSKRRPRLSGRPCDGGGGSTGLRSRWSTERSFLCRFRRCTGPSAEGCRRRFGPCFDARGRGYARKGTETRGKRKDCVSIEARPKSAEDRTLPGHGEGAVLLGPTGQGCVATLVGRTSRFGVAFALPGKASDPLAEGVLRAMKGVLCRSLTVDHGKEFARHKRIRAGLGVPVSFAPPRSPWERGTNESTKGLLREFLPKGKDLRALTQTEPDGYLSLLDNRPRRCLGWRTPAEGYREPAPPCCV